MLFNDNVKCQDYTALDSVVRETLFIVDMFQCIEMSDVLKILWNLEKGPTKFWKPRPETDLLKTLVVHQNHHGMTMYALRKISAKLIL